jgi:serine phosphatase RsbU (regulator of sigma subunit)
VAALAGIGSLAVAVGVALLLANTVNLRNSSDSTVRADAYTQRVVAVERLLVDAETGLRGYVITGRPLFLAPARGAEAQLPSAFTAVRASAVRDHSFLPEADALISAGRSYIDGYVPRVEALVKNNPAAARSLSVTFAGKNAVDDIRARATMLERLVSANQLMRQSRARASANHSIITAILALVILTVLTAIVGALLGHFALERDRARELSERTTRSLQESILPAHVPPIPSCQVAIRFTPAGDGVVGGDFYDVFEMTDGRWAVVVGDVCGKGAEAAAVSAMARWTLRSLTGSITRPEEALRFLNEVMVRQEPGGRFVTIAFLLVDVRDDRADVLAACAGHPPPVLVPASGEPATVDADGDLLGVWPSVRLHAAEAHLAPGDSLVLYTDGVTDQGPGELISPRQTLERRPAGADAERLASMLENLALRPRGPQRDDIAVVALRFVGSGQGDPGAPSLSFSSPLMTAPA